MRVGGGLAIVCMLVALRASSQYVFERLTTEDGLPGRQALALCEDADGFMWIGTDEGLARDEGVRIRTWHHDRKDPRSLPNDVVWDITQDERGTIWVATDHGLCAYDEERGDFDRVYIRESYHDATSANRIHRVRSDGQGLLWLSTEEGIHSISTRTQEELPLPSGAAADRARQRNTHHSLAFDAEYQRLWIGVPDGVLLWDAGQGVFKDRPTADAPFACLRDMGTLHAQPDGRGGVLYFNLKDRSLHVRDAHDRSVMDEPIPILDTIAAPQTLRRDEQGRIWCGTWGPEVTGVRDPSSVEWNRMAHRPDEPWTVMEGSLKSWCQDANGRIWLGTYGGLAILDPEHVGVSVDDTGLPETRPVTEIVVLDSARLLIGTDGDGIFLFDRRTGKLRPMGRCSMTGGIDRPGKRNQVVALSEAPGGWYVGTMGGLLWLDTARREVRLPDVQPDAGGMPRIATISFIQPAPNGGRWVGTWHHGVFLLDSNGIARRVEAAPGKELPSQRILSCASLGNELWLGCNNGGGLLHLRDGILVEQLLHEPDSSGASYGVVRSLALAEDGTLYIGTYMGGFGVRDAVSGTITWYTRRDGLGGDRIEQMLLDGQGGLWMVTNRVLSRFDRATSTIHVVEPPLATLARGDLNTIALDADGSLLCAYGTLIVDLPTTRHISRVGPPVCLTHWSGISNAAFAWPTGGMLELEHDERALSLEFGTPPSFSGQETRFAYRLAGADTAWRMMGNTPRVELNDLPAGLHRLEVRASNGGSDWSAVPLSLQLLVHPAFWSTWWFKGTFAILLIAMLTTGVRLYLRRRIRREREHFLREQAILHERLRIADDMHDDLGTGLSALKLRGELALATAGDEPQRERLRAISDQAGELLTNMRQIIWAMGTTGTTIQELVAHTIAESRRTLGEHGIHLDVEQLGTWPTVQVMAETRRNLFLIVKEAIHNAVKHAKGDRVILRFLLAESRLTVEVEDNGRGVGAHGGTVEGHGSRAMKRRAEAMGAELSVHSGSTGTNVTIHVPLPTDGNIRSIGRASDAPDLRTRGN